MQIKEELLEEDKDKINRNIKKERNVTIDTFRLICALMVITIHSNLFIEQREVVFVTWQSVTRLAVPFFFAVSGIYFGKDIKKKTIKLLKMYVLVSIPYIILECNFFRGFDINMLIKVIINFFTKGNYYHLWYFPTLIWGSLIIYFISKRPKIWKVWVYFTLLLYFIACLGDSYYGIITNIDIFNRIFNSVIYKSYVRSYIYALSYITLGNNISKIMKKENKIMKKIKIQYVLTFGIIVLIEEIITWKLGWNTKFTFAITYYPFIFVLVTYLYKDPLKKYISKELADYANSTSSIIYFFHPLLLIILLKFSFNSIVTTFLTCIISIIVTFVIYKIKIVSKSKIISNKK